MSLTTQNLLFTQMCENLLAQAYERMHTFDHNLDEMNQMLSASTQGSRVNPQIPVKATETLGQEHLAQWTIKLLDASINEIDERLALLYELHAHALHELFPPGVPTANQPQFKEHMESFRSWNILGEKKQKLHEQKEQLDSQMRTILKKRDEVFARLEVLPSTRPLASCDEKKV